MKSETAESPAAKAARLRQRALIEAEVKKSMGAFLASLHPRMRRACLRAYLASGADFMDALIGPLAGITALAAEQGKRCSAIKAPGAWSKAEAVFGAESSGRDQGGAG